MTTQSELELISYNIVYFNDIDQPLHTELMESPGYWAACTALLDRPMPNGAKFFNVRDMDGNIPAN